MSQDPFALGETPLRRPHRLVVLGVILCLVVAALAAKLAGLPPFTDATAASVAVVGQPVSKSAPFAGFHPQLSHPSTPTQQSQPATTSRQSQPTVPTQQSQPPGLLVPPYGQWIATGRVLGTLGVANLPAGTVTVQAWTFRHVCGQYLCNIDLTRGPSNGTHTGKLVDAPGVIQGEFPPYSVPCVDANNRVVAHVHGTQRDAFLFTSSAHEGVLTGQENGAITGCGPPPANITTNWTATKVPQLQVPTIPISPRHVASASAFVAAATQECTRVNAEIEPLTATIESDQQTIEARRGVVVAEATSSLAETLPKLIPLAVRVYSEIPQPPEPLDVLWTRAVQIEQDALKPTMNYMAVTAREMNALSRYVLTENKVQAQDAAAYAELAHEDAASIPSPDALIGPIEQQLNLPSICTNLPAYSAAVKAIEA